MKVLVSACIMGENCKYNGKNNKNSAAIHFLKDKEVISICPEVLAGMETPRPCAEIVNGRVVDENGNDVSLEYNKAVAVALSKIQNEEIDLVILQSRSPTCGVNQIYDGSFTGKLVSGMGLFAKALKQKGYVPFLSENQDTMTLQNPEDAAATVEIPVLGFTKEPPVLREEYDNYALVQIVSLSTWKQIEETIGNTEPDTYIRILSEKERTLTELSMIETELTNVLGHDISFEVENRIQEKIDNDAMLNGYKLIIGALCVLLAFIGIANVFSNTLGFIRQRKREFARYMSIGMTPEGMRKMFWIEALVIAGRPVLITLPIAVVFVWLMIAASYLNPMEFLAVAPIVPILLFIVSLFGFVALAYYLGGKKILKCNLVEALRTDYMG